MFVWGEVFLRVYIFYIRKAKYHVRDTMGKSGEREGTERYFSLKKVESFEHIPSEVLWINDGNWPTMNF